MLVSCSQKIGYNSVDAGKFAAIIQKANKIQIVDVRTPDEFNEGHLPGAVNIDVNGTDFAEQIKKLDVNKRNKIFKVIEIMLED